MADQAIALRTQGKIAIITLNRPKKLNALDANLYYRLAVILHDIAARDEIEITVLVGKGKFFSAYGHFHFYSMLKLRLHCAEEPTFQHLV
jgi:Delta3-Delta2-enoyl-CoA isomerase